MPRRRDKKAAAASAPRDKALDKPADKTPVPKTKKGATSVKRQYEAGPDIDPLGLSEFKACEAELRNKVAFIAPKLIENQMTVQVAQASVADQVLTLERRRERDVAEDDRLAQLRDWQARLGTPGMTGEQLRALMREVVTPSEVKTDMDVENLDTLLQDFILGDTQLSEASRRLSTERPSVFSLLTSYKSYDPARMDLLMRRSLEARAAGGPTDQLTYDTFRELAPNADSIIRAIQQRGRATHALHGHDGQAEGVNLQ